MTFSHHRIIDLTTAAGEKVIDRPNGQADRPLEDTKAVDAPHHEIAHVRGLTPGYPQIEHMDVPAVAHPSIDAAPERLHSRVEGMDQGLMVGGGLPHDAFRPEEMIDPDRLLLPGGLDLLQAGRAIYLESSADAPRREQNADKRERPSSRSRQVSPAHIVAAPESSATSRRSSPSVHPDRTGATSIRSRSRSPIRQSPSLRPPLGPQGRSPYRDPHRESETLGPRKPQDDYTRNLEKAPTDQGQLSGGRSPGNIPTQPRSSGIHQPPPSGPSQGPKVAAPGPNRGPHNMSLLSAPTRPRRGPGSRDGPWGGSSMARRGPPAAPAAHGVPSGPRASFSSPATGVGGGHYRHVGARQHSVASANPPAGPKGPSHLAGLSSITPGGRVFPSTLDPATEKRLLQLETDREKLLEQVMETQRSKRAGLRDWDRLDRESSICALKSELAEGHLQRMAEESSIGGGVLF
ncbi:uncharacterized protein N7496_003464 [Penicillium cataractarum]|uniref:Uncharacterized protein n=1 Tax=Penicillium cataractarum TaxID=2100454 RepID=A0A9W9SM44_9EURO|nr:uncharacterized protein N7496_003464 [Penicillium cataractarum]KAJ5381036.1 hypothetical protein N7496_003464 [Penicillium cataractarum]